MLLGSSSYWMLHSFHSPVPYWHSWFIRFCNGFTIAYLFAWLITVLPSKWSKRLLRGSVIAGASILFLIEGISFGIWGLHISPTILTLAAETNGSEMSLTISVLQSSKIFWQGVGVWIMMLALYFVAQRHRFFLQKFHDIRHRNIMKAVIGTVTLTILTLGCTDIVNTCRIFSIKDSVTLQKWFTHNNEPIDYTDNLSRLLFSIRTSQISAIELGDWRERQQRLLLDGEARTSASDSLQIVCIIGESFIRNHSNIYGYPLNTTPRLEAEAEKGNLIAFTDITTFSPNTSLSLKSIMHINPNGDGNQWSNGIYWPVMFRRAGFDVSFNDNQMIDAGSVWTFALASVLLDKELTDKCYTNMYIPTEWKHDLEFVDSVTARQPMPGNRALSIYHLRGQHLWAEYPRQPQWERFTTKDIPTRHRQWLTPERLKRIADYDNATHYNDSVIAAIISRYHDSEAVIVYFSDHGEEIYDYRDAAFRQPPTAGMEQEYIDYIYRVPFMVWMSDAFIANHPAAAEAVKDAANRPGTLSEVSHLLMKLGEITTPSYDPTHDISSPHYIPRTRTSRNGIPIHPSSKSGT